MIHYHGTPITPKTELHNMRGRNFCVSFANPADADDALAVGQSILWDNGAFPAFTKNKPITDWTPFYQWVEPKLGHPHWAVALRLWRVKSTAHNALSNGRSDRSKGPFSMQWLKTISLTAAFLCLISVIIAVTLQASPVIGAT